MTKAIVATSVSDQSVAQASDANVTYDFVSAVRDLRLVPTRVSDTVETANDNTTKINNYFARRSERRGLVFPGDSFGFTDSIVIPNETGNCIIGMGGTDLRAQSEFVATDGLGGRAARLVRIGSSSNPVIYARGYGLNILGTLVLEGTYSSGDRNTKIAAFKARVDAGTAPIGFLQGGKHAGDGLGTGKLNAQGLVCQGMATGVQFAESLLDENNAIINHADQSHINHLMCFWCKEAVKILGSQSLALSFTYVSGIQTTDLFVVGTPGDANPHFAGGKIVAKQPSLVSPYNNGVNEQQTLLKLHSCSRSTAHYAFEKFIADANVERLTLFDCPSGSPGGPAHVEIGGHNSNTNNYEPGRLFNNQTLILNGFYYLTDNVMDVESSLIVGNEHVPDIVLNGCRVDEDADPANFIRNRLGTLKNGLRWYGCRKHLTGAITDGRRLDGNAAEYVQYA